MTALGAIVIGAIGLAIGEHRQGFTYERDGFRNLLLRALGTESSAPGQVRVPISVDGANYEVIIAKPGVPKAVPITKNDAD